MIYSFYDSTTGIFTGRRIRTKKETIAAANCGATEKFIEGLHDPSNRRVDLATNQVIAYQPAAPDDRHVWNADAEAWQLPADIQSAENQSAGAMRRIQALELEQLRPLRELSQDDTNQEAAAKLARIDAEIVELRKLIISTPQN